MMGKKDKQIRWKSAHSLKKATKQKWMRDVSGIEVERGGGRKLKHSLSRGKRKKKRQGNEAATAGL